MSDLSRLLHRLADGCSLEDAAREAGFATPAAAAALEELAARQDQPSDQRRRSKRKGGSADRVAEVEALAAPPKRSPYRDGDLARAYTDGASRGNPGPAAYGCVYTDEQGVPLCAEAAAIGRATNNVAEYRGLIAALNRLSGWKVQRAVLRLDSQLVVRQMEGRYRVKDPTLQGLYQQCKELAARIPSLRFEHIPREENQRADAMANRALDGPRASA